MKTIKISVAALALALLTGCVLEEGIKQIPLIGNIYRLPDFDQSFTDIPFLNLVIKHRSILTHNALLPLAVAWFSRPFKKIGIFLSLLVGSLFAFHFLLDLFPKKWYGYAFIHVPFLGWMDWLPGETLFPTIFSIAWLGINMLLSLFAFVLVLKDNS